MQFRQYLKLDLHFVANEASGTECVQLMPWSPRFSRTIKTLPRFGQTHGGYPEFLDIGQTVVSWESSA